MVIDFFPLQWFDGCVFLAVTSWESEAGSSMVNSSGRILSSNPGPFKLSSHAVKMKIPNRKNRNG
jgi:hypothetical protein